MCGSSPGPGPQLYLLTKPCRSLLLCTFLCQTHIPPLRTIFYWLNPLFLPSASRFISSTLTTMHPIKQSTSIHLILITKSFLYTLFYSFIYSFLNIKVLPKTFSPHFINSTHTLHALGIIYMKRSIPYVPHTIFTNIHWYDNILSLKIVAYSSPSALTKDVIGPFFSQLPCYTLHHLTFFFNI